MITSDRDHPTEIRAVALPQEDRFWSKVVRGPAGDDCWIWTGALGDDGYGRFWLPGGRAVRPHRYVYEHVHGVALDPAAPLRHWCDVPLCVHVEPDPARTHLLPGTHSDNMLDRTARGTFANQYTRIGGSARRVRVEQIRRVRDHVKGHGYDRAVIAQILAGYDPEHPTLW